MKNIIQGQKKWSEFEIKGKVGVIGTLFTEQFLEKSYLIKQINYDNFKIDIELNGIETVFIDNDLFESDHDWYKKNRGNLINFLKNNNKNIVVIKNTTKEIAGIFKQAFILNLNFQNEEYLNQEYYLNVPLLVNEKYHNPVSSKWNTDIVYLNIGTRSSQKSHNLNFDITSLNCTSINLSKEILKNLIEKLKSSKIVFINYSKLLDEITLKYIEIIAYLNSTYVIYDHKYNLDNTYFETYSQATTDNIIYTLLTNSQHHLKKVVSKQRDILRLNTMIIKLDLKNYLKSEKQDSKALISVITPTNRKENLLSYIERMNNQNHVMLDVVLVTHGFEITQNEIEMIRKSFKHTLKVISRDTETTLGECLNAAIDLTEYPVIAKVDDDDFYYSNYLFDQWLAIKYSKADIVGKSASFYYFERDHLFVLRRVKDHSKFCEHIMGATIMSPADIMKKLKFSDLPRAVDSDFIKRLKENKGTIYANHPYEMCVFRSQNLRNHTWSVDDMSLYRHARIMGYGNPEVFVAVK